MKEGFSIPCFPRYSNQKIRALCDHMRSPSREDKTQTGPLNCTNLARVPRVVHRIGLVLDGFRSRLKLSRSGVSCKTRYNFNLWKAWTYKWNPA